MQSYNYSFGKITSIIKTTYLPIFISALLLSWFYIIQSGEFSTMSDVPRLFNFNHAYIDIENAFSRTISHANTSHIMTNTASFFVFSYILISIQNKKYYLLALLVSTVVSTIIFMYYPNVIGFSLVVMSLHATALIACFHALYTNLKSSTEKIDLYKTILYLVIVLYMSKQVMIDVSFYFGIFQHNATTLFNMISASGISDGYGPISAKLHLFGSAVGFVTSFIVILYKN